MATNTEDRTMRSTAMLSCVCRLFTLRVRMRPSDRQVSIEGAAQIAYEENLMLDSGPLISCHDRPMRESPAAFVTLVPL